MFSEKSKKSGNRIGKSQFFEQTEIIKRKTCKKSPLAPPQKKNTLKFSLIFPSPLIRLTMFNAGNSPNEFYWVVFGVRLASGYRRRWDCKVVRFQSKHPDLWKHRKRGPRRFSQGKRLGVFWMGQCFTPTTTTTTTKIYETQNWGIPISPPPKKKRVK